MLRNFGAVILGMVAGSAWNMALIQLNSSVLYPLPAGADMQDPEQAKAYVATLPVQGFLLVIAAHVGQAGIGGWVAARVGASRPMVLAGIVGGLTLLGTVWSQIALEGPAWMWIEAPLVVAAAWWAGNDVRRRRAVADA